MSKKVKSSYPKFNRNELREFILDELNNNLTVSDWMNEYDRLYEVVYNEIGNFTSTLNINELKDLAKKYKIEV